MPGRRPTPTALRILSGNPQKRPLNRNEPALPLLLGAVRPPSWLPTPARKYWRELIDVLQRLKVLSEADLHSVALAASELHAYAESQRVLGREGHVYSTTNKRGGVQQARRPEVVIASSALANFVKLSDRLGLNPAYRSKLQRLAEPEKEGLDELRRRAQSRTDPGVGS